MDRPDSAADGPAYRTLPTWAWLVGACALFAWHGWLTLSLFGPYPWHDLTSEEPIVSGVHPQHLYLAHIGARGIASHGRTTIIDVRFQALYPKTPIFDGARVAELTLLMGGGAYRPSVYKIGFASLCMLVPILLLLACRSIDLGPGTTLLAAFLGLLIWWGPHGRAALVTGDCELYLASLAVLAHIGLLVEYHRTASVRSWIGLLLTGCLGWFLQPLFFPILLPVLLVYYLSVGVKHDFLTWHVAFWSVEVLGVLINWPWLSDWIDSWWLRTPLPMAVELLQHRTFVTIWQAPIWGGATSRSLAVLLTLASAAGVVILNQTHARPTARMLGLAGTGSLVLALLGISWEPLGAVGTAALLAPALWFACPPAAHAGVWCTTRLWRRGKLGRAALVGLSAGAVAAFTILAEAPHTLLDRCVPQQPLEIGLGPERQALVDAVNQHTAGDARILWEDRNRSRQDSRWPALLPILTERNYIGGLDPDGFIEHSSISLIHQALESWPIATEWTDEKLMDYCRRYNVRWIVAWSPAALERFSKWPAARKVAAVHDDGAGWLFEVERRPNFAIKGHAEFLEADGQHIMLGNVVPEAGEVVISLHYHAGMRASPARVQVERAKTGDDSIGFVRLRLAVPAARVTLSWEK